MLYSFWVRHRLDEALGKPETLADHAGRLLISGGLAELVSGEWEMEGESTEPGAEHQHTKAEPARPTNVWLFRAGSDGEDEEAWWTATSPSWAFARSET